MNNWLGNQTSRRIACPRCGADFTCEVSGACWCAAEAARLVKPVAGEDCLCRECLRKAAESESDVRSEDAAD